MPVKHRRPRKAVKKVAKRKAPRRARHQRGAGFFSDFWKGFKMPFQWIANNIIPTSELGTLAGASLGGPIGGAVGGVAGKLLGGKGRRSQRGGSMHYNSNASTTRTNPIKF